ncbi:UbiA prenyltransferase family protein [Salipiger sp. 1_MG-2023]|uniref:UbiA prenyltransferase family protein n=1 Tax=Salipiger sp. 1_MG-2023 TaxID=3062665 RepID=UPI0026E15659|nr:UbiA prenyltransferase family protein [Salipiger sp. 1_MG-2023]MDO6588240.1 UbiA prenyltransferase family protein [Salipiger sp. 1_MG-2023]
MLSRTGGWIRPGFTAASFQAFTGGFWPQHLSWTRTPSIEKDRLHPGKRHRPLASGAVSPRGALRLLGILAVLMAGLAMLLPPMISIIVGLYIACNLTYSLRLKSVPIIEILLVAAGFALRASAGYAAFRTVPDPWVIATVFSGSLLLTVGKRREEMRRVSRCTEHRPVLAHYSPSLLDAYMQIAAVATLGSSLVVLMQVVDAADLRILFFVSLPFILNIFLRYLLVVFAGSGAGNPTRLLLSDRTLQGTLIAWAALTELAAILAQAEVWDVMATFAPRVPLS